MNDVSKLMGKMTKAPEEKDELRAFLENTQQVPALERTPMPIDSPVREGEMSLLNQVAPIDKSSAVREGELKLAKRRPFQAQALKAKQEASETPLGRLFGMEGLTEAEKQVYADNRDADVEQAFERGTNMGMGMGSIGSTAGKGISAARAAQRDLLQDSIRGLESQYAQAAGKEAVKIGQNIVRFKDKLSKLLGE